jgi:C4-dicarboxylate-specific signal transduction histidine kinase
MPAMPAAAPWFAVLLLAFAAATVVLRQRQLLRAANERERLLERQLSHACGFALAGQLGTAGLHETGEALEAVLARADSSQALAVRAEGVSQALQGELLQLAVEAMRAREGVQRLLALLQPRGEERESFFLHGALEEALALLQPQARERGMELVLQACAASPCVRGERMQLQLVVLQLLANAMEAMDDTPPAQRRVLVTTHDDAGRVEVQVSDRGHGFGARRADTLFAPYYTTKPGHMGLGLPVARRIVEAHEGRIEARRRAGGGAVFTVSLPRQAATAEPARALPAARSPSFTAPCVVQP